MNSNIVDPPTATPDGQELASVASICVASGLPRTYVSTQLLRNYIIPCVQATFSDGELSLLHAVETDPVLREHFGESDFDEGAFGNRLRGLTGASDPKLRYAVDALIRRAGRGLARLAVSSPPVLPPEQTVAIDAPNGTITFDGQTVSMLRPLEVVVDFGPGVQGRFHIDTQWNDLQNRRRPFAYFAFTRGPFINEFLMSYWLELTQDPEIAKQVVGSLYMGREDGMASSSEYLVQVQTGHVGSPEMADLVLASGIYSAGRAELRPAIANAHKILRPGGALLVRSPESVDEPEHVDATEMIDLATAAGFRCSDTFQSSYPRRKILSAVLRK
ncbi:hypothetical protein [Amycolatopsis sp. NPDC004079]|uniref:hypothetical protein n=1 Tax=Amycolatopsis sp. NPDC004079 TaxID=3154549 RepID=UPI0033B6A46A